MAVTSIAQAIFALKVMTFAQKRLDRLGKRARRGRGGGRWFRTQ